MRLNDTAIDPDCDGTAWKQGDKRGLCCPGSDFMVIPECMEGSRKCEGGGKYVKLYSTELDILNILCFLSAYF